MTRPNWIVALSALVVAALVCVMFACTPAQRAEITAHAPAVEQNAAKGFACAKRVSEMCAAALDAGVPACSDGVKAVAFADCLREPLVVTGACIVGTPGPFDVRCADAGDIP
jgi:hypothetical protein